MPFRFSLTCETLLLVAIGSKLCWPIYWRLVVSVWVDCLSVLSSEAMWMEFLELCNVTLKLLKVQGLGLRSNKYLLRLMIDTSIWTFTVSVSGLSSWTTSPFNSESWIPCVSYSLVKTSLWRRIFCRNLVLVCVLVTIRWMLYMLWELLSRVPSQGPPIKHGFGLSKELGVHSKKDSRREVMWRIFFVNSCWLYKNIPSNE